MKIDIRILKMRAVKKCLYVLGHPVGYRNDYSTRRIVYT